MKQLQNTMNQFFDEKILTCQNAQIHFQNEDRVDEANFEKIKANVYDIFKTVLKVAAEQNGEDKIAVKEFFADRLNKIPAGWKVSYEKAAANDDVEKAYIEKLKLDVVSEIEKMFKKVWEA